MPLPEILSLRAVEPEVDGTGDHEMVRCPSIRFVVYSVVRLGVQNPGTETFGLRILDLTSHRIRSSLKTNDYPQR